MSATEEAVEAGLAEVMSGTAPIETKQRDAQKLKPQDLAALMEAELFIESGRHMRDAMRFAEWDPTDQVEQQRCFDRWVQEFGGDAAALERAKQLRNLVRALWLGKKDAPRAIDVAQAIYVAGVKKRATDNTPKQMNVQVVQMSAPMPQFAVKRIENE